MGLMIRKALPEDAYDYAICGISCWQSAYKGIVPDEYLTNMLTEKEQRAERFRKAFTDPGNIQYYHVMYTDKMIGILTYDIVNAEIWAIYLIEEFWDKGYGKKMLDFAINELRCTEPNEIFLWVFEKNKRARRFYEKHNFVFDGTKKEKEYGKPLTCMRYVLDPTK
jgi:ribosomal protein S18 acetylase RimI-like enzyme